MATFDNGIRTACPAATDLAVEHYADERSEPRGRLIAVNTDTGTANEDSDVDLLDEWMTVANIDSTQICSTRYPGGLCCYEGSGLAALDLLDLWADPDRYDPDALWVRLASVYRDRAENVPANLPG